MKYVIFKRKEMVQPVIFGEQLSHSDIKAGEGWEPVSAGFCYLDKNKQGSVKIPMKQGSVSLNMMPHRGDDYVIGLSLKNMNDSMHYMDYGHSIYPEINKENVKD